jgi:Tfp pilus assembly protein PilF
LEQGKAKEAEAASRKAITLQPDLAEAYNNLGLALADQQKLEAAVTAYQKAIALRPDLAEAHSGLGTVLGRQGKLKEAEAAFREAFALRPNYAKVHYNLGSVYVGQGKHKEAEASFRRAIDSRLDIPEVHFSLGNALRDQHKHNEAVVEYREAIRRKPDYAGAHCNLGLVLKTQGQFANALNSLRRGDELGRKTPGWNDPSATWVRQCERLVDLDRRLPDIRKGGQPATPGEQLEFAMLCEHPARRLHAAAVRLYASAFAVEPKLANDLQKQHRYNAACAAALAAAGKGEDAIKLSEKERATWRRQALDWLTADLAAWTKVIEQNLPQAGATARRTLTHWQKDSDLASVRDEKEWAKLPTEERAQWRKLWADVDTLLRKIQGMPR